MKVKIWKNTELKGSIAVGENLEQAAEILNAVKNFYDGFNNKIVTEVTLVSKDDNNTTYKFMIDND